MRFYKDVKFFKFPSSDGIIPDSWLYSKDLFEKIEREKKNNK